MWVDVSVEGRVALQHPCFLCLLCPTTEAKVDRQKQKQKPLCCGAYALLCEIEQWVHDIFVQRTLFDSRVVWWRKSLCVVSFALHKIFFAVAKSLFFKIIHFLLFADSQSLALQLISMSAFSKNALAFCLCL